MKTMYTFVALLLSVCLPNLSFAVTVVQMELIPAEHALAQAANQMTVCVGDGVTPVHCDVFQSAQLGSRFNYRRVADPSAKIRYLFNFSDSIISNVPENLPTYFVGIQFNGSGPFTWKEAVSENAALRSLPGPTGPAGIQGPRGPTGPRGFDGPIGQTGPAGQKGPTGAMGVIGDPGQTGPQGNTGARGPDGPAGPQGIQGPVGFQGPQGATGAQGQMGPMGDPRSFSGYVGVCTKGVSSSCQNLQADPSYTQQSPTNCSVPDPNNPSGQSLCSCYYIGSGGCSCNRCLLP